jgi:hypothetical protein
MKLTRRSFLQKTGSVAIIAAVAGPISTAFGQSMSSDSRAEKSIRASTDPLGTFTQQSFVPYVGEEMSVKGVSGRATRLRLIEVNDLSVPDNEKRGYVGESFSLIFDAGKRSRLADGVFDFDHYALGKFSLLLVPVGMSGNRYEAVVNRIAR